LFRRGDSWNLYVVKDGRAVVRGVQILRTAGPLAAIASDLNKGEPVIVYLGDRVAAGFRSRRVRKGQNLIIFLSVTHVASRTAALRFIPLQRNSGVAFHASRPHEGVVAGPVPRRTFAFDLIAEFVAALDVSKFMHCNGISSL